MSHLHVMIDLETMATSPDAAVVAVAAVTFDPFALVRHVTNTGPAPATFYRNVELLSSVLIGGGAVDTRTIDWWRTRPEQERDGLLNDPPPASIDVVMGELHSWLADVEPAGVWSHGASFDPPILALLAKRLRMMGPLWDYKTVYDTRTLFMLAKHFEPPPDVAVEAAGAAGSNVAHKAIADCVWQIRKVQESIRRLSTGKFTLASLLQMTYS